MDCTDAAAITSLYIPGFDPQPVTANELGVGSDGLTTWLIAPGVSSGTLDDSGFFGPGMLIVKEIRSAWTILIIFPSHSGSRSYHCCAHVH